MRIECAGVALKITAETKCYKFGDCSVSGGQAHGFVRAFVRPFPKAWKASELPDGECVFVRYQDGYMEGVLRRGL